MRVVFSIFVIKFIIFAYLMVMNLIFKRVVVETKSFKTTLTIVKKLLFGINLMILVALASNLIEEIGFEALYEMQPKTIYK